MPCRYAQARRISRNEVGMSAKTEAIAADHDYTYRLAGHE